jgi:hypothetical protein
LDANEYLLMEIVARDRVEDIRADGGDDRHARCLSSAKRPEYGGVENCGSGKCRA